MAIKQQGTSFKLFISSNVIIVPVLFVAWKKGKLMKIYMMFCTIQIFQVFFLTFCVFDPVFGMPAVNFVSDFFFFFLHHVTDYIIPQSDRSTK